MKHQKNVTIVKGRSEGKEDVNLEKSLSPSPMKKNLDQNLSLQLRDLSPFRPLYGSFHLHNPTFITPSNLSFIQTPIQRTPFKLYLDQVDEGFRQISGLIAWEENNSNSSECESDDDSSEISISKEEKNSNEENNEDIHENSAQVEKSEESERSERQSPMVEKQSGEFLKKSSPRAEATSTTKKRVFCNCKKTKCLKLYCDCFRQNLMCTEGCNCCDCHNLESFEDQRNNAMLSLIDRNPLAFIPKIDTQKQHSKGCHCKKSNCLKKYCECYQAGIKCGENCKCEDCKNGKCSQQHNSHQNLSKSTIKKEKKFQEWILGN